MWGKSILIFCRNDFRYFFMLVKRMSKEGLKARNGDEDDLVPFNALLPIYKSAEDSF